MNDPRVTCLFVPAFIAVVCTIPARGGEYSDPSGFSLKYPDDWVAVADPAHDKAFRENVPPKNRDWLDKNQVDLSKVAMVLVHNDEDEGGPSINVFVEQSQIIVNDASVKRILTGLAQRNGAMGVTIEDKNASIRRIGNRDVIVIDYCGRFPAVESPFKQMVVAIPGGGKTYIVACTAKAEEFAQWSEAFETILLSVTVPEPVTQGVDWESIAPRAGLAVIACLVFVIMRARMRNRPKRVKAPSHDDNQPSDGDLGNLKNRPQQSQ